MIHLFKKRLSLAITLVLLVFGVLVATFVTIIIIFLLLSSLGLTTFSEPQNQTANPESPIRSLFNIFIICILIGTTITAFLSKKALNPIRRVIASIHQVAAGNFNVKVDIKGIGELEELSESFNKMTQELASIETLRSDFINNFSHEFKTPIISIRGFAKLLQDNNLTEEERTEYLNIIVTESERLSALSSNILMLAKYENLEIIVDQSSFRLDEQIRKTIILMELKWSAKHLNINIDLEKVTFFGNEELTQQIWINLLDNAIKFSDPDSSITINLEKIENEIRFTIQDEGMGMNEETKSHIFDKFFQGNTSHASTGNGLGLPLVKRIVDLCRGKIQVQSELGNGSLFTILLYSKMEEH
ncbi:HAMP domain-containing sensor histidine kinase [Paenibacillus sp. PsM32]|uniref:HAMP domain-containing sensor histidine kinase n=1 Tax=Paenibacillus sp. PsM32 TaxID=3030536 RepID=UPI00263BE292|nr:HAMP domain-containing sensor histidine kinase [Paenibacillus sp. PsM32]MDN4618336.1 HAMP domain-containing sensor histidine kinase [Paenibacillus sp. PsM32]